MQRDRRELPSSERLYPDRTVPQVSGAGSNEQEMQPSSAGVYLSSRVPSALKICRWAGSQMKAS